MVLETIGLKFGFASKFFEMGQRGIAFKGIKKSYLIYMRVLRSWRRNLLVWELRFLVPQSREDDNEDEVPEFPIPQCREDGNEDDVPELVPIIQMEIVGTDFGFSSPFGGMGDIGRARSRGFFGEDILYVFRNNSGSWESSNNMLKKGPAIEQSLVYSLEDLFTERLRR
ncbi:hypothetical protein Scep_017425 [Stephania cephalantha]|uniref:Uncharacterized protein n=1 Tax=Stephania cephalantha TaxID=152367 RepID=A0AAP0NTJ0_9MAGN